jgi:WD40 repeat protein
VLLFFFAGQAAGILPRSDEPPGRPGRDYLLPVDARAANVDATGWRLGDAIDGLAARGTNPIVCLLDTSPAGRIRAPVVLGTPPHSAPGERMLKGISRWPGVTTWLAATEKPAGQAQTGAGLFTRALMDALGTRAEARNLMACLDRLRRDPDLARQRFRTEGGFESSLTFWPGGARHRETRDPPLLQRGHGDRVTSVAFTADGSRMITTSMDSTLRIWHAASGTLTRILPYATNGYRSLALSRDGFLLAAGGGDGTVHFHDLDRDVSRTIPGSPPHPGTVDYVAFVPVPLQAVTPGGQRSVDHVLSVDNHGRSLIWDATRATVRLISQLAEVGGRLPAVATRPGAVACALVVPDKNGNDSIRAFDFRGNLVKEMPPPSVRISALCLSDDGGRLWVGTENGGVEEFEAAAGNRISQRRFEGEVRAVVARPSALFVVAGSAIHFLPHTGEAEGLVLRLGGPIARTAVSLDGGRVAASDVEGKLLRAWEIEPEATSARALDLVFKGEHRPVSLAFSPGAETLVSGDQDGAIRSWELDGRARPTIAASRGRVRHVAVSADEKLLLQVTDDEVALIWDLDAARRVRRIPDRFRPAGGFLKSGDLVLIDRHGDVVIHDGVSLARRPVVFERPMAGNGARSRLPFHKLVIASDGRIAGACARGTLVCVWTADGRLALKRPIRDHRGEITAVSFSGDGRTLLTAADDGLAKLWDVAGAEAKLLRVVGQDDPDAATPLLPVTAAALSPVPGGPIALGRKDGKLEIWYPGSGQPRRPVPLNNQVRTVCFSADGKLLAAGGDDRRISLREVNRLNQPIPLQPRTSHFEAINALAFWRSGRLLASASDDSTVRLWRLDQSKLSGTLWVSGDGADWVVFTPDGLYDASSDGERRVTWVQEGAKVGGDRLPSRLEQYRAQRFVFDLANALGRGEDVKESSKVPQTDPPTIRIEPVSTPTPKQRRVDLRIRFTRDISNIRLYQNGVAVAGDLKPAGANLETSVTLVHGPNRVYALAGRPGSIDGRSNQLEFVFDGPTPGRTHILALGVSKYKTQSLRFADKDAEAIAAFLHQQKLNATPGPVDEPIILVNEKVNRESVSRSFQDLRRRVRGRPEDTVVVFLAGHTLVRDEFFCLLLPDARIPDGPPVVALRGPVGGPAKPEKNESPIRDQTVLPYGTIHNNLSFMEALNRLVIVDACQASALFDDPRVRGDVRRSLRRIAENDAHQARTSYILATRRGERQERAQEAEVLRHGLLTYVLLRGMGETGLSVLNPELPAFLKYPNADLDRDGWVDTGELRQYSDLTVPALIDRLPRLAVRGPMEPPDSSPFSAVSQESETTFSFPLVEAPAPSVTSGESQR